PARPLAACCARFSCSLSSSVTATRSDQLRARLIASPTADWTNGGCEFFFLLSSLRLLRKQRMRLARLGPRCSCLHS
ncbi:hypothetical protein PFISCL1PPCAC_471, partial [Pristionchus fissidentatus]